MGSSLLSNSKLLPLLACLSLALLAPIVNAAPYKAEWADYNINTNTDPWAKIPAFTTKKFGSNSTYWPSPSNWRDLPIYTILLDKQFDGTPSNNDYFQTQFEAPMTETNFRHGGDINGLVTDRSLDYLYGMGIRTVWIAGTPFLNMPWQADGYSALDFTLIDPHWGTVQEWANAIDRIHAKGMYVVIDFTIATMGNMVGWAGKYFNTSAPFSIDEYDAAWLTPPHTPWNLTQYPDFNFTNTKWSGCTLPEFWADDGTIVSVTQPSGGCYNSSLDQYGDMEAFGVHPDWQRQLSKFSGVQDRLREWNYDTAKDLEYLTCLFITALDIDGLRIDKGTQMTVQFIADWGQATRSCAAKLNKTNFHIVGEVTGGDTFGSLYMGRGRTPAQRTTDFNVAMNTTANQTQYFLRSEGNNGFDAYAFMYSFYRSLTRILQLDGNLDVADDIPADFVVGYRDTVLDEDALNPNTGVHDPRHWMGSTNHDIFRWPSMTNGTYKQAFATYILSMLLPGIPLLYYGEEQGMYVFDNGAANYLYGRQAMTNTLAWKKHGCYKLGSTQYHNFDYDKSLFGCEDDWNALDHFDPTHPIRRTDILMFAARQKFPTLLDGFQLDALANMTYYVQFPGSNITQTEIGLRSQGRSALTNQLNQPEFMTEYYDSVWYLWHNENKTVTYNHNCGGASDTWIKTPYPGPANVTNLFYPYETLQLTASTESFYSDGNSPYRACLQSITLAPFQFKAFVPADIHWPPPPTMSSFVPGHDARLLTISGGSNETTIPVSIQYDNELNCNSFKAVLQLNFTGAPGSATPELSGTCGLMTGAPITGVVNDIAPSAWAFNGTITNAPDGIYEIIIGNVTSQDTWSATGSTDHLLIRKGTYDNIMVWTDRDYASHLVVGSSGAWKLNHTSPGADLFRYSADYGVTWSSWTAYETSTDIPNSVLNTPLTQSWTGIHMMVQYWSYKVGSAAAIVHGDAEYTGGERRVPRYLARGSFNNWGFDQGVRSTLVQLNNSGNWELPIMYKFPTFIQLNVFGFDDYFWGDADGDGVMDLLPPSSLSANYFNMTAPPKSKLGWTFTLNDKTGRWSVVPRGHVVLSLIVYILLIIIPPTTAVTTAVLFRQRFYAIKINKYGVKASKDGFGLTSAAEKKAAKLAAGQKIIGWPEDPNKRRKVIIATLEYEILDWKIKVKIGGLGVMSKLMGTAMEDCDLVWVIPKVKDVEYPPGEYTEPIEVIIFGEPYLIDVETHVYKNITYIILDSPVFRAQTKSDPYPARMDDLSSAIFYSTWNQAIAETIRRNPVIDIYHINDYHGTLAPLYLLPKVFPTCLSLHNAEFQGLWPLRNKEEMNEVCAAFNLPKEVTTKYVQYGNTFNLLHAGASFIAVHQKSIGVAGVSDKYGKRSWARYPALWTLKHIDSLPNPDPDDIAALETEQKDIKSIQIDREAEAKRPGLKRQAQEWAHIKQDPEAQLFVFVGRWSKQKGVDIIADVFPALFESNKKIQLIAVGPVIDLYGRFAAEKLARLMEMYPDQVYSKPEFTSLPPYLFSGADFALIPSRDEPFGLVAVEFGRKGALGVGARLGGLGLMPGWWFPVESNSTSHMITQLQRTIKLALKSSEKERAILRARSAVQRFPVLEWRQRIESFQKRSIRASRKGAGSHAFDYSEHHEVLGATRPREQYADATKIERIDWNNMPPMDSAAAIASDAGTPRGGPAVLDPYDPNASFDDDAHTTPRRFGDDDEFPSPMGSPSQEYNDSPYFDESDPDRRGLEFGEIPDLERQAGDRSSSYANFLASANRQIARRAGNTNDPFFSTSNSRGSIAALTDIDDGGELIAPSRPFTMHSRTSSRSSISSIVDEHGSSSPLNKAMETFTDANGAVAQDFVQKLKALNSDNSKGDLCIEKYLEKAEKIHFVELRKEKVADSRASFMESSRPSIYTADNDADDNLMPDVPLTRSQIFMGNMIGEWPLYSIVMSIGQLLGASAFQLVLLSGTASQTDLDLYVIGSVYFVATIAWWCLFRLRPSATSLSLPWAFYSAAFLLIGVPSLLKGAALQNYQAHIQSGATWSYAIASAAGFLFFGMNFGEEAGATTDSWIFRACIVQGLQQIWTAALWWWGSTFISKDPSTYVPSLVITYICWPLAVIAFVFFIMMWYGLPPYYQQSPPTVPNFWATLWRRNIVRWFLVAEILRDFWLSSPYGRNWQFLWSGTGLAVWATAVMAAIFFVVIWAGLLAFLTRFAKIHSWLLPVFAIGLGAPRWCQMFWGVSGIGSSLPWAGKAGPFLSAGLWLWLGVLDAIQGVGLGMALLQTLSRFHVCAAIMTCQALGSIVVIVARAGAPDRLGPSTVFPDLALWDLSQDGIIGLPVVYPLFWICLICQLVIPVGYLWLFRKEQLSKP